MAEWRIIERDGRDELGEGPVWLPSRGRLHWVDIMGQKLWALDLASGATRSWDMPERIGWVIPRRDHHGLIAGFKSGIARLTLDPLSVETIATPEADRPQNRLNDAKVDASGRIWFGSKDDTDEAASGALYRLDADGGVGRHDDGYQVTNGPTFSPDGRQLYHTDSGRQLVYRFDLNDDGSIRGRQVLIHFEQDWGYPDGMTTDAEGCLWIAHWGGARVSRFDPDGRMIRSIALPATNITSCTFAGEGLDRMFVTSAWTGTEGEPHAGALFEVETGVHGLPPTAYAG